MYAAVEPTIVLPAVVTDEPDRRAHVVLDLATFDAIAAQVAIARKLAQDDARRQTTLEALATGRATLRVSPELAAALASDRQDS
jgi:hypothetical protein